MGSTRAEELLHAFFASEDSNEKKLDLSNCQLTKLPDSFNKYISTYPKAASRLELLNLAHNELTSLPNCLSRIRNLRILFLLANRFRNIPPVIAELPACTMLSFKSNQLEGELRGSSLPHNISWLILTSNKISSLSEDFGRRCSKVRKLMLANNRLSELSSDFVYMTKLELLRLSNNNFQHFPATVLSLPKLAWLALAGNPCTGPTVSRLEELPARMCIHNLEAEYEVQWGNDLGGGTSGNVYAGVHRDTGRRVAVKKFKSLVGSDGTALDEVAITLEASGVQGIVKAVGYCVDNSDDKTMTMNTGEDPPFMLISELVPGDPKTIAGPPSFASCTRSVYQADVVLSEEDAHRIVDVVRGAVEGLLARGISHGDVYGHNVLVGNKLNGKLPVVLGDLGAAWRFGETEADGVRRIERRAVAIFTEEVMSRIGK